MDFNLFIVPPSPVSEDVLSLFTILNDDISLLHIERKSGSDSQNDQIELWTHYSDPLSSRFNEGPQYGSHEILPRETGHTKPLSQLGHGKHSIKNRYHTDHGLPSFICFSSTSGEPVARSKRSAFTQERRKEVRQVRQRGACLRCQIRKIPVRFPKPTSRSIPGNDP